MTEQRRKVQRDFYRWLLHRRNDRLSFRTIKQAAIQFLKSPGLATVLAEHESVLDLLFYPLLKKGVVCYQGSGLYGLSPTCHVLLDQKVLLVNAPVREDVDAEISPGLQLVDEENHQSDNSITVGFNLGKVLNQITSFEKVLQRSPDFPGRVMQASREWLIRRNGEWVGQGSTGEPLRRIEIFKNSDNYASPTNLKIGDIVYEIPDAESNPQAYALASMLTQISNHGREWSPVTLSGKGELVISLKVFPYQLEKCFFLETLRLGYTPEEFRYTRNYRVDKTYLPKLNQLFLLNNSNS